VKTSLPPITSGMRIRSPARSRKRAWSSARSGDPGAKPSTGSLTGGGGRKRPGALTARDCRVGRVRVGRHSYTVADWGSGELWTGGRRVVAHAFTTARGTAVGAPTGEASAPEDTIAEKGSQVCDSFVADLLRRIHMHLRGERTSFADVPLDLSWCTPFQVELARALQTVPWGEVVTYGELAALAGRPGAARAAGSFCARNQFWLFLPCHRVVSSTGIGGYGETGVGFKRKLLALEDVAL
jgi:methylated-DNA-[protein]-cysteine S-methyltransferase